jgi:hypothetical protein
MRLTPQRKPESTRQAARARNHLVAVPDLETERRQRVDPYWTAVVIRPAVAADAVAVLRLAALDSARPPAGETLVAEQAGSLVAALSLSDGDVIADPFRPTADIVGLLRMRAGQLRLNGLTPAA